METMTPPRWAMHWWRRVALAFVIVPALAAIVLVILGEPLNGGAIAFSAIIFALNFSSVRDVSRRRERLDQRAAATGQDR